MTAWASWFLSLLMVGSAQAVGPIQVGQWARTQSGHRWLAGVVEVGIAGDSSHSRCLALNRDDSGFPYSIWLHNSDSLQVWVPKAGAPPRTGGHSHMGHWVGIGSAERSRQLCP